MALVGDRPHSVQSRRTSSKLARVKVDPFSSRTWESTGQSLMLQAMTEEDFKFHIANPTDPKKPIGRSGISGLSRRFFRFILETSATQIPALTVRIHFSGFVGAEADVGSAC